MPLSDKDIKREFEEAYRCGNQYWWPWWFEADKDLRAFLGDQWSQDEYNYLASQRRAAYVFNKVRRIIKLVTGYERKHRLSLTIEPIENSDEETAGQLSDVIMWLMKWTNLYYQMSDCFEGGGCKTGMNLLGLYVDYAEDPLNGDIRARRIPHNGFIIDPNFSERDLSDCGWLCTRKYLPRPIIQTLLPGQAKDIEKMRPWNRDNKFNFLPLRRDLWGNDMTPWDEYWKRTSKEVQMVVDMQTGETKEWPKSAKADMHNFLAAYPHMGEYKAWVPSIEFNIFVGGEVMYNGPDPWGLDDFPFVPVMGFYDPEHDKADYKLQGLVRCIRDPQMELNRRRSKMIDIIDSQINSGWFVEEETLMNPQSIYQTGQGRVVYLKSGTMAKGSMPTQMRAAEIPESLFRMDETYDRDIMEIPGANADLLGLVEKDDVNVAGVLTKLRQGQALTVLQDLFDNYSLSITLLGKKLTKLVQMNYQPNKIKRIIKQEPTREFYAKDFGKYGCTPSEGILSDTQRSMYYYQLVAMQAAGIPIPNSAILDAAPIQGKKNLKEYIAKMEEQQGQVAQVALQDKQLAQAAVKARIFRDTTEAQTKKDKTASDIILDRAQTAHELALAKDRRVYDAVHFVRDRGTKEER